MPDPALRLHDVAFTHEHAAAPLFQDLAVHLEPGWTGVVGANGVGKTTLLQLATGVLTPSAGRVEGPLPAIYCPQRTDHPPADLATLLAAVDGRAFRIRDGLGVGDDWLERWTSLSHGERKRAQVAAALWREPLVLALDEPTNHLDLVSIECLEDALADCPCALLLVSHDRRFLARLTEVEWRIERRGEGGAALRVRESGVV